MPFAWKITVGFAAILICFLPVHLLFKLLAIWVGVIAFWLVLLASAESVEVSESRAFWKKVEAMIDRDCIYFSGSTELKCTVNPRNPCFSCPHVKHEEECP